VIDVVGDRKLTPMLRQYADAKAECPAGSILMFRMGDFYEMFFEDAVIGAKLLDLTLTTRDKGKDDAVPMCGVPHHAVRGYIAKLTELGRTVVTCEQTEDPKLAKGLVKREVVRVITPGIVLDDEVLAEITHRPSVQVTVPGPAVRGSAPHHGPAAPIARGHPLLPVLDEPA